MRAFQTVSRGVGAGVGLAVGTGVGVAGQGVGVGMYTFAVVAGHHVGSSNGKPVGEEIAAISEDETAGVAEADGATVCWPASAIPTTEATPRMTTNTAAAIIPAAGVNCFNRFLPVRPPGLHPDLAQNCRAGY